MVVERLYHCLQSLPSRDAEQALLAFRASNDAWDISLGIISGMHGPVPEPLTLFAAQTLLACARRATLPKDGTPTNPDDPAALALISRQRDLLNAVARLAGQEGHNSSLLCVALGALSVRNVGSVCDLLHAALQQLSPSLALQLLISLAEECEALQARSGSQVGHCASVQHVLREEVGPPVLAWLAGVAPTDLSRSQSPPRHAQQQPLPQAAGNGGGGGGAGPPAAPSSLPPRLASLAVRCLGAWCRLGCLHAARCPVPAVREVLALALRCVHPAGGAPAALRHEACEALGDVIEHGPDPLLREIHAPLVQLAAAAAATATAALPGDGGAAHAADADAVYGIVQLISSYATARLGELVAAACCSGGAHTPPPLPPLDRGAVAAAAGEPDTTAAAAAEALVGALCQLASLPFWAEGGYPVSWPAMLALTDLAVGCIAALPPPPPPPSPPPPFAAAAAAVAGYGVGGGEMDAMQQDSGAEPPAADTVWEMATGTAPAEELAPGREHCVPDITLGPRPGMPAPLLIMYDKLLRSVLSCCVAWSSMDAGAAAPVADAGGGAAVEVAAAAGLLRLPPECDEALRGCLQACGGVVGQVRQLETAVALLQHHNAAASAAAAAAEDGWPAAAAPPATSAAALTAALAAVSACGALPVPAPTAASATETAEGATAAAAAAARVLLAAADHLRGPGPAAGLPGAPPLPPGPQSVMLQYCEALAGSCKAVLQLELLQPYHHASGPQPAAVAGLAAMADLLGREAGPGGVRGGGGGEVVGGLALHRLADPVLTGLRHESTAVAAARALRALVAAARELALALPAPLAAELADAVHALPYDAGPRYLTAEREVVRAAVAAAAGAEGRRADMWQRLLSPAVATVNQIAAAAATQAPPTASTSSQHPRANSQQQQQHPLPAAPPAGALPLAAAATTPSVPDIPTAASRAVISRQQDAALARQLRLLGTALEPAAPAALASASGPSLDAATAAIFVKAWPALRALLRVGGAGRFLLPLCRCLAALLRRAAARGDGASGEDGVEGTCDGAAAAAEAAAADDPWVVSVLMTLADCVGRPGAKYVYEPLVTLLEVCVAPTAESPPPPLPQQLGEGAPGSPLSQLLQDRQEQRDRQRWRWRHAVFVARMLTDILYGGVASALAATWRAADRDPDTAECLLRLATAAVRFGGPAVYGGCGADGGGAAIVDDRESAPASAAAATLAARLGNTTRAAAAVAALRLAAASSGCDHRQVASAALTCTCAVLEAACGSWPPVTGGLDGDVAAAELRQLLAVVLQLGPQVVAGLLAALLSSSPLPRLQRVATALVLLGAAVAFCFDLEQQQQQQQQQQQHQQQQHLPDTGGAPGPQAMEACSRLLGSWLAAAAAYLRLPEHEGAALAASWGPLLAEAGLGAAAVAACSGGGRATSQRAPPGGASLTSPLPLSSTSTSSRCAPQGGAASAARGLSRKLRRLLREFAESRLRP